MHKKKQTKKQAGKTKKNKKWIEQEKRCQQNNKQKR